MCITIQLKSSCGHLGGIQGDPIHCKSHLLLLLLQAEAENIPEGDERYEMLRKQCTEVSETVDGLSEFFCGIVFLILEMQRMRVGCEEEEKS